MTRDGITKRVGRDGTVRWQVRWRETAPTSRATRHAKTFATREQAEAFARTRRRPAGHRAPATMTVAELIDETLERATDRLSERTILTYRNRARTMVTPYLGDRRLIDLETIDVQRWVDRLVYDGYKPATIHAAVAVLYGALRDAHLLGMTERNVAAGIRRPRIRRAPMTVWTADEARRFLTAVRHDPIYGTLWHVALATGMRPGELRALMWEDVDLDAQVIQVRRTISKGTDGHERISSGTKRGKGRAVAISAQLAAMLRRHRARQAERRIAAHHWQDLGLVFDRGDGHWLYQGQWREAQQAACQRAGVPFLTAHGLRHTSASLELERGTHPRVVMERLGHSSIETLLDIYSHVDVSLQARAADAMAAVLFEDDEAANG